MRYRGKEESMIRHGLRRIICAGLVLTTLLGLAACGGEKTVEGESSGWGEDNTALAKEFVYTEQMLELPETLGNASVQQVTRMDSNIYAVWEIYGNEEMPESKCRVMSMREDGSDIQFKDVQISYEAEAFNEHTYVGFTQFAFSGDKLFGIKEHYALADAEPAGSADAIERILCCWDLEGSLVWEKNLELEGVWKLLSNADGGVSIVSGGNSVEIEAFTAKGEFKERISLSTIDRTLSGLNDLFVGKEGTLLYTYVDEKKDSTMWLNVVDLSKKTIGEAKQLPDSFRSQGYRSIVAGDAQTDVVYTTPTGVYAIGKGETAEHLWMSFINSDVPTTNMNHIVLLDETQFIGFYFDDYYHTQKVSIFTKTNSDEVTDKTVLVLAGYYVPQEVKSRVVQFNKTNPAYRIVIKEYHTYDTMEDGMAGYNRLNMDIMQRGLPDILIADSYFPISGYISKGLLADIDELIAADEELSKTEFMDNVFDAYRVGGKLYYVTPSFSVKTLVGKTSLVGERTSWTMEEMMELMASMPEGTQMIGELTGSGFVEMMMQYCGNDFVDVETGKCNFNSENFIAMLEYARKLPEDIDWSDYGDDYWETQDSQYRENRTLLAECEVSNVRYVNDYINGYFGEEISYIGFPSATGNGAVVEAGEQYLISARSENIEGAWEFVRYYLTEEYQKEVLMLPVNKDVFLERAMEATRNPYTIDSNGDKTEYEYKLSIGGESVVLPNMTEEQVNEFVEFVENIDKCVYYDEDIEAIINEEVASFLADQKSAAEVAKIIQSRVELYVNENR